MNRRSFFAALAAIAAVPSALVARVRRTWYARNNAELQEALANANPRGGDTIVLSPGTTYTFARIPKFTGEDGMTYIVSGDADNG